MAATKLIAMHQNKGKTLSRSLHDRTEYAKNGEKTRGGELVSAYACDPETVDEEFILSKQEYLRITGRQPRGDIIAWQIRQSFRPGEITAEEANQVGYETALRFTKGEHAFIAATHTDREHIHNHIIFNSTNLHCDRKFRDFFFVGLALQKLSDIVCLEHAMSVIEPRRPGEREKRTEYPKTKTHREDIRELIDLLLHEKKPGSFDEFMHLLEEQGYEIKSGKNISIRSKDQKSFIRMRSLGDGYREEDIRKIIRSEMEAGTENETIHSGKRCEYHGSVSGPKRSFDMLVDINRKMAEGKGRGYERWAKTYNVKQVSKALIFLQEKGIRDYDSIENKVKETTVRFNEISGQIKEKEKRLAEIAVMKTHIINYVKTKDTYVAYRKSGYSKKYLEAHRDEILLHNAAKKAFADLHMDKIPKVRDLSAEYAKILTEKKELYAEYRLTKKEMQDFALAKQDIDQFLKIDEQQRRKTKREKSR